MGGSAAGPDGQEAANEAMLRGGAPVVVIGQGFVSFPVRNTSTAPGPARSDVLSTSLGSALTLLALSTLAPPPTTL